jgi:hypothetical protein
MRFHLKAPTVHTELQHLTAQFLKSGGVIRRVKPQRKLPPALGANKHAKPRRRYR